MFYVKTADKLQRTSVWMESLDGGLAYLQQVVIEDSLGLGQALEAQMQSVVDTYQCEWKSAVENPAKRAKFRPFINQHSADLPVPMTYQRIREQRIPALVVDAAPKDLKQESNQIKITVDMEA